MVADEAYLPSARFDQIAELEAISVRDGLELTQLNSADGQAIVDMLEHNPEIAQRVTFAARISQEGYANQLRETQQDPTKIRYGIRLEGRLVGVLSFWQEDDFMGQVPDEDSYGFGFFRDARVHEKGVVTTSVAALMERASEVLPVKHFVAFCEDDNTSSQAVLRRLGFERTDEVYGEPENGWQERKYRKKVMSRAD